MVVYRFGDIVFQPTSAPNSFRVSEGVNLVEQERLVGAPTLQDVGGVLKTIEWEIELLQVFGDVRARFEEFRNLMLSREPKPLINSTGFSEGDYVIANMTRGIQRTDHMGRMTQVNLTITLKEFIDVESPDKEALAAKNQAIALASKTPLTTNAVFKPQTPQSLVMRDIVAGNAAAISAAAAGKQASSVPDVAARNINQATKSLETARRVWGQAKDSLNTVSGLISNASALDANLSSGLSTIGALTSAMTETVPNLTQIRSLSNSLESVASTVMSGAAQLATVTVLRK